MKEGNFYKGYTLQRSEFERWLLKKVEKTGAKVIKGANLVNLITDNSHEVKEAIIEKKTRTFRIKPSIIIAADGVESNIGEMLGVIEDKNGIGYAHSWEMENLSIKDPHLEQIYFGDFSPGSYAYVFPKSRTSANVGVASTNKDEKSLEEDFDRFVNEVIPSQTKDAEKTIDKSGRVPSKYNIPPSKWQYRNVLFTGDAANQNIKPYVEGILPAMICGDLAGKTAVNGGKNYLGMVRKKVGNLFDEGDVIFKLNNKINKFEKEKRYLLRLHLWVFRNEKKTKKISRYESERIKREIKKENTSLKNFTDSLGFYLWYLKAILTGKA